jgi:hypothetical protein
MDRDVTTHDQGIKDSRLTKEEYLKAKVSIKCGKSCGEDGVMPVLLKYVSIDDIILGNLNSGGEQPDL